MTTTAAAADLPVGVPTTVSPSPGATRASAPEKFAVTLQKSRCAPRPADRDASAEPARAADTGKPDRPHERSGGRSGGRKPQAPGGADLPVSGNDLPPAAGGLPAFTASQTPMPTGSGKSGAPAPAIPAAAAPLSTTPANPAAAPEAMPSTPSQADMLLLQDLIRGTTAELSASPAASASSTGPDASRPATADSPGLPGGTPPSGNLQDSLAHARLRRPVHSL